MASTTPDNIYFATAGDNMSNSAISAAEASSVQNALNNRQVFSYLWPNATARGAQTGMVAGASGYQQDTKVTYTYSGTAWAPYTSAWTAYSPTSPILSNPGTGGSQTYAYRYLVGDIQLDFTCIVGTGFTVNSPAALTLPVPCNSTRYSGTNDLFEGFGAVAQDGTPNLLSPLYVGKNGSSTTSARLFALDASQPWGVLSVNVSATSPLSVVAGGSYKGTFRYRI